MDDKFKPGIPITPKKPQKIESVADHIDFDRLINSFKNLPLGVKDKLFEYVQKGRQDGKSDLNIAIELVMHLDAEIDKIRNEEGFDEDSGPKKPH